MSARPLFAALLAVLLVPAVAVAPAAARRVAIGMGEQQPSMFGDPRWARLGLRDARYLVDWDALAYKHQRRELDTWMARRGRPAHGRC